MLWKIVITAVVLLLTAVQLATLYYIGKDRQAIRALINGHNRQTDAIRDMARMLDITRKEMEK